MPTSLPGMRRESADDRLPPKAPGMRADGGAGSGLLHACSFVARGGRMGVATLAFPGGSMARVALVVGMVVVWACGPIDQGGTPSGGGGPGATDAGIPPDGGTSGGGGATDGGTAGTDGGTASAPLADCTGVMPGALPSPVTVTVPHGSGDVCWNATADLGGNVAAESHPGSMGDHWTGRWQIWSPTGQERGILEGVGGDVFGQQDGFESTQRHALVLWSSTGAERQRVRLDDSCAQQAFPSATGGVLVLEQCGTKLKAHRYDAQAKETASAEVGDGSAASGVVDAQDRVLIVASSGGSYVARWFGANLAPLTDPFTLQAGGQSQPMLRPLAGGGAAVQLDGKWVAVVASGAAVADAPPAWLASHDNFDLQVIRGGHGYALIPRAGATPHDALDLYGANGDHCGPVSFPAAGLSMGPDGTVIGASADGCTDSWWSALLR